MVVLIIITFVLVLIYFAFKLIAKALERYEATIKWSYKLAELKPRDKIKMQKYGSVVDATIVNNFPEKQRIVINWSSNSSDVLTYHDACFELFKK
jgi:hypothetical protein